MKRLHLIGVLVISIVLIALVAALAGNRALASQKSSTTAQVVPAAVSSEPTLIQVYVLARGGKFLGDDIGGAQVTLRDAVTKEFIASGRTRGGSGPADLATLKQALTQPITTVGAAVFTTTLALDAPRLVEIEAYGPSAGQATANRVTATKWVLPQSIAENKILLEMPGLNVEVLDPPTHFMPNNKPPLTINLKANVTMMCGCPIGFDTDWKPDDFEVWAMVTKPDGGQDLVALEFDTQSLDGAPSQFKGTYTATQSGIYQVIVMAYQPGMDNTGSDHITFIIK